MAIESVSLFELLDRGERFKLFAESVLGKGWVSDEELHLTRVAFRYAPEGDEFKPLVRKYGFDEVCELSLQSTAFRQNSGDFLYLFWAQCDSRIPKSFGLPCGTMGLTYRIDGAGLIRAAGCRNFSVRSCELPAYRDRRRSRAQL